VPEIFEDDMKLTKLERYFISNQLKILEALYENEAEHLAVQREAIESGYEMLYDWGMEHIFTDTDVMTREESLEVWDTLDMFDAIGRAVQKFGESKFNNLSFSKFAGYDGNNEGKFMSFASYTVERLKRFRYVAMREDGYWNSHMPIRDIYCRMLDVWRQVPRERRFELSLDETDAILAAAIHPDNR
jgi:uncharacterized protein YfbU (UPF0304 family)